MTWRESFRTALRGFRRRPLRNGLALAGVALGTATLVGLLALSAAARRDVVAQIQQQPMLTTIHVVPAAPRAGVAPKPLDARAVSEIAAVAGVREVLPIIVVPAALRIGDRSPSGTVAGLTPAGRAPYALEAGRAPSASETALVLTAAGLRAFGGSAADALGRAAQLELRRGGGAERKTIDIVVVGVASGEIPGLAIVPLALAEDALAWIATGESAAARDLRLAQQAAAALLFGGGVVGTDLAGSRYSTLWAVARSLDDLRSAKASIEALGYGAFSAEAAAATVDDLFRALDALLAAVAAIALILAGLGVVNALVTSVSERTVEISVLKAIGATDEIIGRLVVLEAILIGLGGGLAGVILGWVGAAVAAALGRASAGATTFALTPRPDFMIGGLALVAATALAALAAWIPARRASRLAPAEALRAE